VPYIPRSIRELRKYSEGKLQSFFHALQNAQADEQEALDFYKELIEEYPEWQDFKELFHEEQNHYDLLTKLLLKVRAVMTERDMFPKGNPCGTKA